MDDCKPLLSGAIALVFNNRDGLLRRPLSIALSLDGGNTWPHVRDLEPEAGLCTS